MSMRDGVHNIDGSLFEFILPYICISASEVSVFVDLSVFASVCEVRKSCGLLYFGDTV